VSGAAGSATSGGSNGAGSGGAPTGGTATTGGTGGQAGGLGGGGTSGSSGGFGGGGAGSGGSSGGGAGSGGSNAGGFAGTAGGAGGSGGGEPIEYQPCPSDGSVCKILPLGDSITWGVGDEANGGYRGPLFELIVAAQQKVTFTGSVSNGPNSVSGQTFPKRNEGHSGWTISTPNGSSGQVAGISGLIPSPAFDTASGGSPHIILMMIGTNDVGNSTAAQMADRLENLVDKIVGAAPDALLVVAKITPVSWATSVVNGYNEEIPKIVEERAAAGKHVELADMNTGFVSGTMFVADNLHPNQAGYEFMADRWYDVIGSRLPK
jgi:lysophospholipase L1-like esterase